jgi:hypothetical protein
MKTYGGVDVQIHVFFTSALVRGEWSGSVVVDALCYKQEGRGSKTRWGERILPIYLIRPVALGPGIYSAYKTNEC